MSTALRLTVDEYHAMIARGAFDHLRGKHVELIQGELRQMSPQGAPHSRIVSFLTRWSTSNTAAGEVEVRVQLPLSLSEFDSEPEPDCVWAVADRPLDRHPLADEVLLLIEVSNTTVHDDLGEMADLYARAGVREYWVVDIRARTLHVFREPSGSGYQQHDRLQHGEARPVALPNVLLPLKDLFP